MAKEDAAGPVLSMLSYEEQMQQLPEFPTRPFLLAGDYPTGELATMAEAKFQMERSEREYQLRAELSGYNANPYANQGPQSPAELELERAREADVRRYHNGLPDSSPEMPAQTRAGERQQPF